MNHTQNEVMQFVRENDVKFIRLGFCDPFGIQKNISIMPEELADAFTYGVSFDASAIAGFQDAEVRPFAVPRSSHSYRPALAAGPRSGDPLLLRH